MNRKEVRTRFAPSPTGYMHIGNLRTALYTYLLAKRFNGKFILRIEDTDQNRYVKDAVDMIYRTLKITGLKYDEGPDIGGKYGPYIQSQRNDIYIKYAQTLVEKKGAYYCFCSKERLESLKNDAINIKKPFKYDGHCKNLSEDEVKIKINSGEKYIIRQLIPSNKIVGFHDAVFGDISVNSNDLDEGVLIKEDGLPTYNFANVIDDHLMDISHVIRGMEYLSSTPKYILLYDCLDWGIPIHVHLPPILKNAQQKFSKRDNDASFFDLLDRGYLKDAIINYISLLGWNPKNNNELFSLQELEKIFDINGIQKSPAIFDINKLNWINSEYIKGLDFQDFHSMCLPYYEELEINDLKYLSKILQDRLVKLGDIPEQMDFLKNMPSYDVNLFINSKMKTTCEISLDSLNAALGKIKSLASWKEDVIMSNFKLIVDELGLKTGQVFWPIRVALTGKEFSPGGAVEIAYLLGPAETKKRIENAIKTIGLSI